MKALLIPAVLLLFVGCSKPNSSVTTSDDSLMAVATETFDESVRTNRLTGEQFFQLIYSGYDKAGRKNPSWDNAAKEFFGLLAISVGTNAQNHELHEKIGRLQSKLKESGCEDPLVRYMTLRRTKDSWEAGIEGTNEWTQAALDLDASEYHPYWKFFSYMRASQAHKSVSGTSNSPAVHFFRNGASDRLVELLKDWRLPAPVVHDAAYTWLINDLWGAPKLRKYTYDRVEPLLMAGWGNTAEAHLIRGGYYIQYAWDARGGGWASTVTDEQWRLMKERLGIARESLERSWTMKPLLDTALRMQWVELGDSRGRKEMERWYKNAIELDPGNYQARMNKLNWIHEKWHGSVKEMLDFGKECLTDTNGSAALTLYEVQFELAKYHQLRGRGTEAEYLKQPAVWRDVKLSFETFFAAHPNETGWRHNYAMAAYKCEAWDDLRKQIKSMGQSINYRYFGGEKEFREMVRKAEQFGKEPVNL